MESIHFKCIRKVLSNPTQNTYIFWNRSSSLEERASEVKSILKSVDQKWIGNVRVFGKSIFGRIWTTNCEVWWILTDKSAFWMFFRHSRDVPVHFESFRVTILPISCWSRFQREFSRSSPNFTYKSRFRMFRGLKSLWKCQKTTSSRDFMS